jgi:pimeloyl-ACP methyl ester carboxylesterase
MAALNFSLSCSDGALTEPLCGLITGVAPHAPVELRCALTDDRGQVWASLARFIADPRGDIDLAAAASVGGDHLGTDPFALMAGAKPEGADTWCESILSGAGCTLAPDLTPLAPLVWKMTAQSGANTAEVQCIRRRQAAHVRATPLSPPLYGLMFQPDKPNGAGVLVLGGSEGGLFPARAALLADAGFTTISLAYFAHPGLPWVGRDLPLEYFFAALEMLRGVVSPVAILGVSRGSEAAQLCAVHRPELVDAVVCWVPSAHLNRGLDLIGGKDFRREETALWALDGTPFPGVGFLDADIEAGPERDQAFATPAGRRYAEEFVRAWSRPGADNFRIPIERFQGPVLAVAGACDALWPSAMGAERIIAAARKAGSRASEAVIHDSAGHLIGTPNEPRPFPHLMHWTNGYGGVRNGYCAYGGTAAGAAIAARASWRRLIAFLSEALL